MDDSDGFVKAVLLHWFWLVAALVSFVASAKINFEDYQPRVALIVVGTVCLLAALYLTLNDQYRALNEYLRAR
jgi:hypothetical protein